MHRERLTGAQQRHADAWTIAVFTLFLGAGVVLLASPRTDLSAAAVAINWSMIGLAAVAVVISWTVRRVPMSVKVVLPIILAVMVATRW